MPENGDPILFPLYLIIIVIDVALIIVYQTLGSSMIADLVEDAEVRTNKRSEGVFFASVTFIRKTTQGIGVVAAGLLLTFTQFQGATPDQIAGIGGARLGNNLCASGGVAVVIDDFVHLHVPGRSGRA